MWLDWTKLSTMNRMLFMSILGKYSISNLSVRKPVIRHMWRANRTSFATGRSLKGECTVIITSLLKSVAVVNRWFEIELELESLSVRQAEKLANYQWA